MSKKIVKIPSPELELDDLSVVNNSIAEALIKGLSVQEIQELEKLSNKSQEEIEREIVQVAGRLREVSEQQYLSVKEVSGFFRKLILESMLRKRKLWDMFDRANDVKNLKDDNAFKYGTLMSIFHDIRAEDVFLRNMAIELGVIPKAASANKLDVNVTIDQSIRRLEVVEKKIEEKQVDQMKLLENYGLVKTSYTPVIINDDAGILNRQEAEIYQLEEGSN